MDYMSIKEASKKWGMCERQICTMCNQKRIPGAFKKGIWLIPSNTVKPARKGHDIGDQKTSEENL